MPISTGARVLGPTHPGGFGGPNSPSAIAAASVDSTINCLRGLKMKRTLAIALTCTAADSFMAAENQEAVRGQCSHMC